jgi:hypothetical protein
VCTLITANHNGWQRGERLDGRDAVQQRVAGADKAHEADDEAFVLGTTAEADGEDSDGWWWWQSMEARAAKWVGTVGRSYLPGTGNHVQLAA